MAYNKSKNVLNAQKLLHQGKVAQAIQEYVQILKHEPKDQATLMTIGDLYVRQGDTSQALEYFERLAQIYLADGFVTKSIAIYKKITKLAPEETRPVEKLAELYVQQGVLSEARPIYLQLAELHQRAGRQPQAAALLHKLLEAEPDNLRVLTRVADLALAMNQPGEAAIAFRSAAEQLNGRGNHAEAIKFIDRAIKIDPKDAHALIIKARTLTAMGQKSGAISLLAALPELDHGGDAAEFLVHLYLQDEQTGPATELASKIFARNSAHFAPLGLVAVKILEGQQPDASLPLIDLIRAAMIEKGKQEGLAELLTSAVERLPNAAEPHQWLVELYKHTSNSFGLSDALTKLARVYEAAGQREQALQIYQELVERDPENEAARGERERLQGKSASPAPPAPPAPPAQPEPPKVEQQLAPPLEPVAQPKDNEPVLDEETERYVAQALTDIDLFSSYGLTQKAIDLLEVVLQRVPGHAPTLERLLDHYLGEGNEKRTAELAAELEQMHIERGNTTAAERFGDLRQRFDRAALITEAAAPAAAQKSAAEFSIPAHGAAAGKNGSSAESEEAAEILEAIPEDAVAEDAPAQDSAVHELDLSEEWEALAGELDSTPAATEEAPAAESKPGRAQRKESAQPESLAAPEFAIQPAEASAFDDVADIDELLKAVDPAPSPASDTPEDYVLELDTSHAAKEKPNAQPATSKDFLEALSSDLDAALPSLKADLPAAAPGGNSKNANASAKSPAGKSAQPPAQPPGPLSEVFDQFRSEMGEVGAEEEDLETHYNLGVAYREMGLIEEAISEFQKVAKGSSEGQAFRYGMQCCTLLGLAFMEKGQPAIAATWYERALAMPGLDQESILALRYDLGVAQELAGDMAAARKSFSQVYGMNIDYRDVAERLSSLGNER
jgi:tetratricopeptide (TPR) repeat protein